MENEKDPWKDFARMQGNETHEVKFNLSRIWEWWKKRKNKAERSKVKGEGDRPFELEKRRKS